MRKRTARPLTPPKISFVRDEEEEHVFAADAVVVEASVCVDVPGASHVIERRGAAGVALSDAIVLAHEGLLSVAEGVGGAHERDAAARAGRCPSASEEWGTIQE